LPRNGIRRERWRIRCPISQEINVSEAETENSHCQGNQQKPEILIFDDSFSALDYKTDRKLRSALKKETNNTTTLNGAPRIGTIKDADKIVVLEEGKTVGIGTHRELMKSCEVYREIAYSQMTAEELEND
jgi:ATP-binding cassette subfamily B protein